MTTAVLQRVLGCYESGVPGPLLIVLAGMHGNEPASLTAVGRVLGLLEERRPRMRGRVVALAGNLAALRRGERYLDRDLNRIWTDGELAARRGSRPEADGPEEAEQRELLEHLERELAGQRDVAFLDLHSTSAGGAPFAIFGDTLRNRRLGLAFDVPVLLGLEENVSGTLLGYYAERGHVAVGVEGGQNEDPLTIDHHESVLCVALVERGMLAPDDVPDLAVHRARLSAAARGVPRVIEIVHRHGLHPEEHFDMVTGLGNFHPVHAGQLLAHQGTGRAEVRAPRDGILLMPRYQGQGTDGFFLGRRVRPFWLGVSTALRRTGMDGLLRLLPGVRAVDGDPNVLAVDTHVARWLSLQVFHLFGFRRMVSTPDGHLFSRRAERSR